MNGSQEPMHESRAVAYDAILEKWAGGAEHRAARRLQHLPALVPPGWPELNIPLDAGFTTTQDIDLCTQPTSNQNCPDWIFVGPGMSESAVSVVVVRPDHVPLVAEVG